jgi:ankyrin repeat protein
VAAVAALLAAGASATAATAAGRQSPLHCAAAGGVLLAAQEQEPGQELSLLPGCWGSSCSAANARATAAVMAALLAAGSDAAAADALGWRPLHWAVARGCLPAGKLLLQHHQAAAAGSKLDGGSSCVDAANAASERERWSPLHLAVLLQHRKLAALLLSQPGCQVRAGTTSFACWVCVLSSCPHALVLGSLDTSTDPCLCARAPFPALSCARHTAPTGLA